MKNQIIGLYLFWVWGISGFSQTDYTQFVNPMIGTSKMGHVFPRATAPFGMVQLSPQTNLEVMLTADGSYNTKTYEYCAGYLYCDSTIIGFSHTNFSGTGHSDVGDFLVMPTVGDLVLNPLKTSEGNKGFYWTFSHGNEIASPGYYKVDLDDVGQMRAWYMFSSLEFYPVTPGSPNYALGSPLVEEAKIHLDNGKTLNIIAKNQSEKNVYVKRVLVNGTFIKNYQISHQDIINGGEIVFEMTNKYYHIREND